MSASPPHGGFPLGDAPKMSRCRHCESPTPAGETFCCAGCEAAFALVTGMGLDGYYRRRTLDPSQRLLRPDADAPSVDYTAYVETLVDGTARLSLVVDGLHCAACVWLIESVLTRQKGVVSARVNMTTRRLRLVWRPGETDPERLADVVNTLGYRLIPYDPRCLSAADAREEKTLLRAMAVAGFAAGNIMLLSVSIWAGQSEGMGEATRTFLHWLSALIALPAIAYAGRPFFRGAFGALKARRLTMDVPISLAVILASGMSLYETIARAQHAYFDAAVGLLFFLLIGRYLDRRARGQARSAAEHLLALAATAVTVIDPDGHRHVLPPSQVAPGMRVFAAAGERIAVDGRVVTGNSSVDTSLIDGESLPKPATVGADVFAGTLNIGAPLEIEVTGVGEQTLLAEITRLVEAAEQQRGRYVVLADRVTRLYAPLVHVAALATFVGWWGILQVSWQTALMNAIAVLIITCPCALGLAVPAVQVIASSRLLRRGILVKSPTALERLAQADTVVFDKTGTLTEGRPELVNRDDMSAASLRLAGSLALASRHPLARALVRRCEAEHLAVARAENVGEVPGQGLEQQTPSGTIRLGSAAFCDIVETVDTPRAPQLEMWLKAPRGAPVRFAFADRRRTDALTVVHLLQSRRMRISVLSGDRPEAVSAVAASAGILDHAALLRPEQKLSRLQALAQQGRHVLMVGDGINDAPALTAAHVSMSPSSAIDVSQAAADFVFQGSRLAPVAVAVEVAHRARRLVWQNIVLAVGYNLLAVPLAMAGLVTPLIAAIVMSSSSILVVLNALRLSRAKLPA